MIAGSVALLRDQTHNGQAWRGLRACGRSRRSATLPAYARILETITLLTQGDLGDILLECRPTQMAQVLLNLLTNAFDAVEKLEEKWVRIEARDGGETVEFAVVDSGAGLPEGIRDKVLQPFFTTKAVGKGTGLGLSIATGIIESHHGTLDVDTEAPNTRFVIRLPKRQHLSCARRTTH